ncbi:hypothetical protein C8R44DRAFT_748939 [Mycena epipterygia]|nr:hypothetical protein C8R44DRAFT_748939 [Mycena epipterygia]
MPGISKIKLNTSEESGLKSKQWIRLTGAVNHEPSQLLLELMAKPFTEFQPVELDAGLEPAGPAGIHDKPGFIPAFIDEERRNLHPIVGWLPSSERPQLGPFSRGVSHWHMQPTFNWTTGGIRPRKGVSAKDRRGPLENPHPEVFQNVIKLIEERINVSSSRETRFEVEVGEKLEQEFVGYISYGA